MWKYILVAFLILIGAIEILLALNAPLREEIMKNSPIQSSRISTSFMWLAGISAFIMAFGLLFYDRLF